WRAESVRYPIGIRQGFFGPVATILIPVDKVAPALSDGIPRLPKLIGITWVARHFVYVSTFVPVVGKLAAKMKGEVTINLFVVSQFDFVTLVAHLAHVHPGDIAEWHALPCRDASALQQNLRAVFAEEINLSGNVLKDRKVNAQVIFVSDFPGQHAVTEQSFVNPLAGCEASGEPSTPNRDIIQIKEA